MGGARRSPLRDAADAMGLARAGGRRLAAASATEPGGGFGRHGSRRRGDAQATATGFVSRAATADRGAASGIYLACYFAGGLVGTAILGQIFDRIGWPACVAGIGLALGAAAVLAHWLKLQADPAPAMRTA